MSVPWAVYQTFSTTDANAPSTPGTTVSSTNTYYSVPWSGRLADGAGVTIFYTGTPTGTFTMWVTDKPNPGLANDNDWVQDTGFIATNPAGAAGSFRDDTANAKGYRKRLKYVNASGSGTITAYVTAPKMA